MVLLLSAWAEVSVVVERGESYPYHGGMIEKEIQLFLLSEISIYLN